MSGFAQSPTLKRGLSGISKFSTFGRSAFDTFWATGQSAFGESDTLTDIMWVVAPSVTGALVGLVMPMKQDTASIPEPWRRISAMLGWSYFTAWSVSFYPQVIQNFRRRSVRGLSTDFQVMNFAGFLCYFTFNAALYWNSHVRAQYAEQSGGRTPPVRNNDVMFGGHALALCTLTLLQIFVYRDKNEPTRAGARKLRMMVTAFLSTIAFFTLVLTIVVFATSEKAMSWLTWLQVQAQVKVLITLVKYCPQLWMNYRRKSLDGWCISE